MMEDIRKDMEQTIQKGYTWRNRDIKDINIEKSWNDEKRTRKNKLRTKARCDNICRAQGERGIEMSQRWL